MRIAGFLSRQAAEKALKAGLIALGVHPPQIHGLRQLRNALVAERELEIKLDDLDLLDPWVIDGRYAADLPDVSDAEATGTTRRRAPRRGGGESIGETLTPEAGALIRD